MARSPKLPAIGSGRPKWLRQIRLIGLAVVFCLTATIVPWGGAFSASASPTCTAMPHLGATFVSGTAVPVSSWTRSDWVNELSELRQVCIDTVIFMASATNTAGSDSLTKLYGSGAPTDVPKSLLAAADQLGGFSIYLGLQTEDGWGSTITPTWASGAAARSERVASEVLADVGPSPSLRGWFIATEPAPATVATSQQQAALAGYLTQTSSQLHALLPGSKVILAPTFDTWVAPASFTTFMQAITPTGVDILTLQDRTGEPYQQVAGDTAVLQSWMGLARSAVDAANAASGGSLALWSDVETYRMPDWTPATTGEIVAAMAAEAPYVQAFAAFSFVHYQSTYGWYPAAFAPYRDYAQTGSIPTYVPRVPTPTATVVHTDATISWPSTPDQPPPGYLPSMSQYLIYRAQGSAPPRLISAVRASETKTTCPAGNAYCFTDSQLTPGATYHYTVQAVNGVGNVSSSAVVDARIPVLPGRSGLALGVAHTVSPAPSTSYPERNGALVDGVTGTVNDQDPAWVGWANQDPTITLDLGRTQTVTEIDSTWLQQLSAWVVLPSAVTYEVSVDGATWTTLPLASAPNVTAADQVSTYRGFPASGTQARWVRLTAADPGGWLFASEITVRGPRVPGGRTGYGVISPPSTVTP